MIPITAVTNAPYPNRITLYLGSYAGPFSQNGPLVEFNPTRDLQVYTNGVLMTVQTWSFDAGGNRYLLYMPQQFNLQGLVQIVSHMPNPSFQTAGDVVVPGFAIIASYLPYGDVGWGEVWGQYWG